MTTIEPWRCPASDFAAMAVAHWEDNHVRTETCSKPFTKGRRIEILLLPGDPIDQTVQGNTHDVRVMARSLFDRILRLCNLELTLLQRFKYVYVSEHSFAIVPGNNCSMHFKRTVKANPVRVPDPFPVPVVPADLTLADVVVQANADAEGAQQDLLVAPESAIAAPPGEVAAPAVSKSISEASEASAQSVVVALPPAAAPEGTLAATQLQTAPPLVANAALPTPAPMSSAPAQAAPRASKGWIASLLGCIGGFFSFLYKCFCCQSIA